MRIEVVMPQMGESVTEGTVTQWLKEPGDHVERDEPLFEITTDKVDAEVPSPKAGVLVEKLVEVGATVEINTVVAILDSEAEEGAVALASASAGAEKVEEAAVAATAGAELTGAGGGAGVALLAGIEQGATKDELRRTRSTPLVRRIAAEHGIEDLALIPGTGMSGRVTKGDILTFIEQGEHLKAAAKVGGQGSAVPVRGAASGRSDRLRDEVKAHPMLVGERDRLEPMGPQRMAIAEHMIRSRATSAHAHTIHEIDFSAVDAARKRMKNEFAERGVKLTYTAFIVKAMADALRAYPMVNSSLDGDQIVYRGDINIGVAVALENSLIVPVVRNVDELSLLGISRSINDLAERARTKRLKPQEVQGGTFTVSNHGIFGPEFGIPIINQPQTAIVSTGAIKKRVVADQKTGAILVRPTAIVCMSFDHRGVDGATADKFLAHVRQTLEGWE